MGVEPLRSEIPRGVQSHSGLYKCKRRSRPPVSHYPPSTAITSSLGQFKANLCYCP